MSNPPRNKGTRFETKNVNRLEQAGFKARRMPAGARYDIEVAEQEGVDPYSPPVRALFTEPDYGRTLVTVTLEDFMGMLWHSKMGAHIECKKGSSYNAAVSMQSLWRKEME